jgi:tellurite resistance protein TerC
MEMTVVSPYAWGGFITFVLIMLALDLGVFHRKAHAVSSREALTWTGVWIALAMMFAAGVWFFMGPEKAALFVTAYVVEESLSVDNMFVFVIVFKAMRVPAMYQHRVLFWGILSALILRAVMIFAGVELVQRFHWLMYVFGAFLVFTGIRLVWKKDEEEHPEKSWAFQTLRRVIPSTSKIDGQKFFLIENGRRVATPLFMALILLELTDILFAVDSIPAVFGVTLDRFIIFTSNIFAILGLRSLYFSLANLMDKFSHLKIGLAGILMFVGAKMLIEGVYKISSVVSLAVILTMLVMSIVYSIHYARRLERSSSSKR